MDHDQTDPQDESTIDFLTRYAAKSEHLELVRSVQSVAPLISKSGARRQQERSGQTLGVARKGGRKGAVLMAVAAFLLVGVVAGASAHRLATEDPRDLKSIQAVTAAAAEIIGRQNGILEFCVDVPAFGDESAPAEFSLYEAALIKRMQSIAAKDTKIVWYSRKDEIVYIDEDSRSKKGDLLLANSDRIRKMVEGKAEVTLVPRPVLNAFAIWIWTDGNGKFDGVIAYVDNPRVSAEVHGRRFSFEKRPGDEAHLGESYCELIEALRKTGVQLK